MNTLFRQLYDNVSSTYTYLLADAESREAVIIDPVFELHHRDLALIKELGLNLKHSLDTHCHADHVTGSWLMKEATGCQIVLSKKYNAALVDKPVDEGDAISFGGIRLQVWATPGHTDGCLTYVMADKQMAFTGDCLMIRGAGRTDHPTAQHAVEFLQPGGHALLRHRTHIGQRLHRGNRTAVIVKTRSALAAGFLLKLLNQTIPRTTISALPRPLGCLRATLGACVDGFGFSHGSLCF